MGLTVPPLWLMRHGQTEWNLSGRMQGHGDSPLTALGRAQAEAAAPVLAGIVARRIASPSGRAVETARLALGGAAFETDVRLREIGMGCWQGETLATIEARHPALFAEGAPRFGWYDHAPGGEGLAALEARCRALLVELDGPAILITHGITLRMLRGLATTGAFDDRAEGYPQGRVHAVAGGMARVL